MEEVLVEGRGKKFPLWKPRAGRQERIRGLGWWTDKKQQERQAAVCGRATADKFHSGPVKSTRVPLSPDACSYCSIRSADRRYGVTRYYTVDSVLVLSPSQIFTGFNIGGG